MKLRVIAVLVGLGLAVSASWLLSMLIACRAECAELRMDLNRVERTVERYESASAPQRVLAASDIARHGNIQAHDRPAARMVIGLLVSDPSPHVREAAAWGLASCLSHKWLDTDAHDLTVISLSRAMAEDKDANVRYTCGYLLDDYVGLLQRPGGPKLERKTLQACIPLWRIAARDRAASNVADCAKELLQHLDTIRAH